MKIRYFLIVFCILWVALYIPRACDPDPDLTKLDSNDYDTIRINNRGLKLSFDEIVLFKRTEIVEFCALIKQAKRVDQRNVITKANHGLCDVYMIGKEKILRFDYVQTSYSGGIIGTNSADYRNDSLFYFLKKSASNLSANQGKVELLYTD